MPNNHHGLLPQFTIANLFLLTSAVAIGVAVSQQPLAEETATWGILFAGETPVSQSLYSFGVVLLVYELLRQATNETSPENLGSGKRRIAKQYRAWLRRGIAVALSGLLLFELLLNRQIIPAVEREEMPQLYGELWPALLLLVVVFVALRLTTGAQHPRVPTFVTRRVFPVVIAMGVLGCGFYVVVDRLLVTNLVHIAIDNVEKSHPISLQRPDAFPNHRAEGFQTFWRAGYITCLVFCALGILLLTTVLKSRWVLIAAWTVFLACLIRGADYCWWFVTQEFPRLNPDMAVQGSAAIRSDVIAGALLVLGLGMVCGYQLACLRSKQGSLPIENLQVSGMLAIGAGAIGVGTGYEWLAGLSASLSSSWWGWLSTSQWVHTLGTIVQLLLYPELMIPLAVCLAACGVVWNYFKPPSQMTEIPIFDAWHLAGYSLATVAWLLVAVPALAILGFCYWLGPWVL